MMILDSETGEYFDSDDPFGLSDWNEPTVKQPRDLAGPIKGLSIFFGVGTWALLTLASFVFALFVWADSTTPDEPKRYPQGGSGWSTQQLQDLSESRKGK
jgi:hypothetical protein